MERSIIEKSWMNPATPNKKLKEKSSIVTKKVGLFKEKKV